MEQPHFGDFALYYRLVENARKFRESAPNQISIFRGGPPPVGIQKMFGFVWFKHVDRANTGGN